MSVVDVSFHYAADLRCESFFPENRCGVQLRSGESSVSIYGMSYDKALALAMMFADEETALYMSGRAWTKLLGSDAPAHLERIREGIEELERVKAELAEERAKAEAEAEGMPF